MNDIRKKLQEEITVLEHELRTELPKEILIARAHGDLSENAEYHAAKERQGFVSARINKLKQRVAELAMIDFTKIPHGKAGLGSAVTVLDIGKNEEITLQPRDERGRRCREEYDLDDLAYRPRLTREKPLATVSR